MLAKKLEKKSGEDLCNDIDFQSKILTFHAQMCVSIPCWEREIFCQTTGPKDLLTFKFEFSPYQPAYACPSNT